MAFPFKLAPTSVTCNISTINSVNSYVFTASARARANHARSSLKRCGYSKNIALQEPDGVTTYSADSKALIIFLAALIVSFV